MLGAERWLPSPVATLAVFVLAGASLYFVLGIEVDSRLDRMLDQNSAAAADYQILLDEFGSDEFVIIALTGAPLFDLDSLDAMVETMELLEELPTVRQVTGIPQVFRDRFGYEDPEGLEAELTNTDFYTDLFINEEHTITGIMVETQDLDSKAARLDLVSDIDATLAPVRAVGFETHVVGSPIINTEINKLSQREVRRAFPMAAIASMIMMIGLLRSFRAVMVVLLCGGVTILITMGSLVVMGRSLNVVTQSLPMILWVLCLANGIHLITRFQYFLHSGQDHRTAVKNALKEVAMPCTLSAITTAFGFLSLMLADVPPIREFGATMAWGMIVALVVNLVLASYLLVAFKVRAPRWWNLGDGSRFRAIGEFAAGHARGMILLFGVLTIVGLFGVSLVKSERNTLTFLPDNSPTVASYAFVGENLTGMMTMDLLVTTPGTWLNPKYWAPIEEMIAKIEATPKVARTISPLDLLRKINQWDVDMEPENYKLPDSQERAEYLFNTAKEEGSGEMRRLINESGEQIRLSVLVSTTDSAEFLRIYETAQVAVAALPAPLSAIVTGRLPQMQHMQAQLVTSQIKTFSLAFILVFASIFVGLRSFRLLCISVVPNLMPILTTFLVMGVLGIHLDAATVMVASIALGIAVDDSVHVLTGYARHRKLHESTFPSILATMVSVGPSITVTSLTASVGFFALATSIFPPIRYFGLLSGIAILVALLADLFFVPAILAITGRDKPDPEEAVSE